MMRNAQPRGFSSAGYVAMIDGRRMEFATYEDYLDYVEDEPLESSAA